MKKFLLIVIILFSAILRFVKLDSYPALNADEAAIGYNAYSLIQTGKDEHGNPWPIHFQSFNDYKPGLYFYLVLPFVKILGLNEWAVRIPGATLGVITVLMLYLLVKNMFKNENLAILSALFLAISPWHIHFSRGGWEVNVATFFIVSGTLFFLKASEKPKYYLSSAIFFVLSLYTYHSARIITPLLVLGLFFIHKSEVLKNIKKATVAAIIGFVILIPLILDLLGPAGISRASGVGLFADTGPLSRVNEQRGEHDDFSGLSAKLLHNKPVNYGIAFLENWMDHYHGLFLFLSGEEIQRNKVPETGQMYLFDILFLAIGLIALIKRFDKNSMLLIWWILIAPVAAALTFQSPHGLRSQNMVIPLVVLSAYGLLNILNFLKENKRFEKLGTLLVVGLVLWNFSRYMHMYWLHMAKEYPFSSQYGVKELVNYISTDEAKFQKVLVTNRYDQPYILFLFYKKYDPSKFQEEHTLTGKDSFGFSTVNHFGKYYFASIKFDQAIPENPNTLIVGTDEEINDEANIVKEIYGSNGYKYFEVVAN